jgi:ankyrin repeat protein
MTEELHWCAESGQVDRLRAAIAAGSHLESHDERGRTPLHVAVSHRRIEAVEILLDAGADLEAREAASPGYRPLHRACLPHPITGEAGDVLLIDRLLERGARPDAADEKGVTPLHLCVPWCDAELVERVIASGAGAGAADRSGTTPLHVACRRGARGDADRLLDDDGEIPAPTRGRRADTALARLEDVAVLEVLTLEEADVNAGDRHGLTPLHVAAERGNVGAVRHLLESGARPDVTDEYTVTPLHRTSDARIVELLLEAGAPLDAPDRDGATPLHRAVGRGRSEVAERLLAEGASVLVSDRDGRTPLHWAAAGGRALLLEKLLDEGADAHAADGDGMRALDLAEAAGHVHVVRALRRRGGGRRRRRFPFLGRE